MSEPFASGHKRPGEPWRVGAASSRAAQFNAEDFSLVTPCPRCSEPCHVRAAHIAGVTVVHVGMCRRCDVDGNALIEHARRAAVRVLVDRGVIGRTAP